MDAAGGAAISVEVLPISACSQFESSWRELHAASGHQPSTSFEWVTAILANHPFSRPDALLVVVRKGSRVVGLMPMVSVAERLLGYSVVTLTPLQELSNTHTDLLVGADSKPILEAWLSALRTSGRRWDLLRLSWLLEDGALAGAMRSAVDASGLSCRWRLEQPSFELLLPDSMDLYLASRSSKFRNYLRRAEKRVATGGDVELIRVQQRPEHAAYFEWLLDIERGSWKHAHGTAISAVPHQTGFYRDLCVAALGSGMLHLTFLMVGREAVAYNLGVLSGDYYSYLKTSFKEQYRAAGVATVARSRLIQSLLQLGLRRMDFPAEPYEWERQWTDKLCWHQSVLVYNHTPTATLVRVLNAARACVSPPIRRQVQYRDPRALKPA